MARLPCRSPVPTVRAILIVIGALSSGNASADAAADWAAGKQAYNSGDIATALARFQSALDSGLPGPAVHYNIAVSHYRLQQFDRARATFEHIATHYPQMRALAEYNLGLVATRLGEDDVAADHYRRAYELGSDNPKLRALAAQQLGIEIPGAPAAQRWSGYVGARLGHDDNVALRDSTGLPVGTTTSSSLLDAFAAISGPWSPQSGVRFEAAGYFARYSDADEFDQSELRGRVFYDARRTNWLVRAGIHASAGTLGGTSFDRKTGVTLRAVRSVSRSADVDVRYHFADVTEAASTFAGIAGERHQLDIRYRLRRDAHRYSLHFSRELNDRRDPAVSPSRNRIGIEYRYLPQQGVGLEAGWDYRDSDYDDLDVPRTERLTRFRAELSYALPSSWLVSLELLVADNEASDSEFTYDRSRVTLGFLRVF